MIKEYNITYLDRVPGELMELASHNSGEHNWVMFSSDSYFEK